MSGLNGVLAGLLVAVVAAWAYYVMNRLWQGSLAEDAAAAIAEAQALGFELVEGGLGARQVAVLLRDGEQIRVEWRDGVLGPRSLLYRGDEVRELPLIRDGEALRQALGLVKPEA